MIAESQDLVTLLEIQQIDLEVMQARKRRAELPQRLQVMRLRKKRKEVQDKLDQVMELRKKADKEMTALEDEVRSLTEKQERAQELIDAAGSDYRKVESHSKEMAGIAKRREELSEKELQISEQLEKIDGIKKQLEGAIAASESEEAKLRSEFEDEDHELVKRAKAQLARRAELIAELPPDLVALYEKTAERVGGVAVGRLVDDTCGICRTSIDGGRLIELRASAPLGFCPVCKRMLVIE